MRIVAGQLGEQKFGVPVDGREQVIEVVRDPAGQSADLYSVSVIFYELLVDVLTATLLGAMLLSRSATSVETIALLSLVSVLGAAR